MHATLSCQVSILGLEVGKRSMTGCPGKKNSVPVSNSSKFYSIVDLIPNKFIKILLLLSRSSLIVTIINDQNTYTFIFFEDYTITKKKSKKSNHHRQKHHFSKLFTRIKI